ncbi:MAG: hypothetical protein ACOCUU_00985 [Nanoarchaeota archaeon]
MKIIQETTFDKAKKSLKESRKNKEIVIFSSQDDDLNRKILEKINKEEFPDILLISLKNRRDWQKQRNSGLDNVMAKLAKKQETIIGINLDEIILEKNPKQKSKLISRLKQNIEICKRNKIKMKFISQKKENIRNLQDIKSLALVLGMSTSMTKEL